MTRPAIFFQLKHDTLNILSIKNLDKSYGAVHAVNQLSLDVAEKQVFGILGPNGSGKTTTLAMIMGTVTPDSGSFQWFGQEPLPGVNRRIGALIEHPNFYPYLNLIRNLKILCEIKQVPESDIERVLRLVGLWMRRKSRFSTLSYGMKQRLSLAGVLLGDPKVLVLDEPTNGLDPEGIAEVRDLILKIAETGKTIILASHILDEVEKVCSHVAILKNGSLLASGPTDSLIKGKEMLILSSEETDKLENALNKSELVEEFKKVGNQFEVYIKDGSKSADLNKQLVMEGVVLTRLEIRKQTLEDQFLELVKQEKPISHV